MKRNFPIHVHFLGAFVLLLTAGAVHFWAGPMMERLPSDYVNQTQYAGTDRVRESPDAEWEAIDVIGRRTDQALCATEGVCIIESDVHWVSAAGRLTFVSTGIYGVNRTTRVNEEGYGNVERSGYFLFPPHTEPGVYTCWDSQFIGPRSASFNRTEILDGLTVYVFHFNASGMDETAGYSFLADVPNRYRILTDGSGSLWVEPISGVVVDYFEQGVSYFVDPKNGVRLADCHIWSDTFTPETREAQIRLAKRTQTHILLVRKWIPLFFIVSGLLLAIVGFLRSRKCTGITLWGIRRKSQS